jgi:putative transposase
MVNLRRPALSMVRQCNLLDISRSGLYYQPAAVSDKHLNLMKLIDRQYMVTPFYGTRKMAAWLKNKHHSVNRKHVRRLMQLMGLKAIYRRPETRPPGRLCI